MEHPQTTAALLNETYHFQSVSGKNADFLSSVRDTSFFFRSHIPDSRSLFVPAGGEITYTVPVKYTQEPLPYALLLFIQSGEGTLHVQSGEGSLHAQSGELLLLDRGTGCDFATTRTPFACHAFYLSGALLSDYLPPLCKETGFFLRNRTEVDDIVWRMLPRISEQLPADDELSSLHLSAMFHLALSALVQAACPKTETAYPKHVVTMKQIFDTDYRNPHSLKDLEEITAVNQYRLCRDFSKYIGSSPVQYLKSVRLSAARHLLRSTNMTVHEVGAAVGIENTTHFINLFKQNTGTTPLQFRQNSAR